MQTKDRTLLTAPQLARVLQVGVETVRRLAKEGKIPRVELSRATWRFDLDEVLTALRSPAAKEGRS